MLARLHHSDKERLATGVILCSLGVRYLNYCANVGRTLLIEPTPGQERNYTHLLAAYDAALKALVPGNRLCDVYAAAKDTLAAADSALAECLAKVGRWPARYAAAGPAALTRRVVRPGAESGLWHGRGVP